MKPLELLQEIPGPPGPTLPNIDFRRERHFRSASERESRLCSGNIGSLIKAFGDDEKNPGYTIKRPSIT
jgi:hypothetical protein